MIKKQETKIPHVLEYWHSDEGISLYCGDCMEILQHLDGIDTVISDPPFSDRTHINHDSNSKKNGNKARKQAIGYAPWSETEIKQICRHLPKKGWVCIITDHILAKIWETELLKRGRYVFHPIPIVIRGRSIRLTGDGPSSWADWMVPSRTKMESKWGTLPGVYDGMRGSIEHMGGKPLNAMIKIVEDYSREGDTVLDFCMGAATTAIACIKTGRKFIGIEKDHIFYTNALNRIKKELEQNSFNFNKTTKNQNKNTSRLFE